MLIKNIYYFLKKDSLFARNVNEIQISEKQKMKDLEKLEKQVLNEERMKDVKQWKISYNFN